MPEEDDEDSVEEDLGEDFVEDEPVDEMEEGYEESNEENVEVAKEMEKHMDATEEKPKEENQGKLGKAKTFNKEWLLSKIDREIKKAIEKTQQYEIEKQREIASFIKQNEKYTDSLKELWFKATRIDDIGKIANIELFSRCVSILFIQTEEFTRKKGMTENPFMDMLVIGRRIERKLCKVKNEYEKADRCVYPDETERRKTREEFLDVYNEYLSVMNNFIQETLRNTIIMTEHWLGREQVTGKPTGY